MIISCPSCHTKFRVNDARLKPDGQKVRCSKCGHLWHVAGEDVQNLQDPEAAASETPPAPGPDLPAENGPTAPETERQEEPANRWEPVLTAKRGSESDAAEGHDASALAEQQPAASKPSAPGADGLTEEQRAKLHAARETQKQARGGFRIRILLILVIVGLLVLLAIRMAGIQIPGLPELNKAIEGWNLEAPVREVGKVEARPVPPTSATEGHIIGSDTPKQSTN